MARPNLEGIYLAYENQIAMEAAGNRAALDELASGWAPFQPQSNLIVPRYLAGYEDEADSTFKTNKACIEEPALFWLETIGGDIADEHKEEVNAIKAVAYADEFKPALLAYEEIKDKYFGLAHVALMRRLFFEAEMRLVGRQDPDVAIGLIDEYAFTDVMRQGLRSALDSRLYYRANNKPNPSDNYAATQYASSRAARLVMMAALDKKVLARAVRLSDDSYKEGARLVNEYASSPEARETMLGYLSFRARGVKLRSLNYAAYEPRVTDELRGAARMRERGRQETARNREERRHHDQTTRQQGSRHHASSGRRPKSTPQITVADRVKTAILGTPLEFRTTLQSCNQSDLESAIRAVDAIRRSQNGISDRNIYLYFHRKATTHEASKEDRSIAQVLALFLGQNFGKAVKFPF